VFPGGVATNIASQVEEIQKQSDHKRRRLAGQEQKLVILIPEEVAQK